MYSAYLAARREAVKAGVKNPDAAIIASYMRNTRPDLFTDGLGVERSSRPLWSQKLERLAVSLEKENTNERQD